MNTNRLLKTVVGGIFLSLSLSAQAALLHLWDFEAGAELQDSAGGLNLNTALGEGNIGGVAGTAGDIAYETGFGGVGQAYRPYYVDPLQSSTAGAGLTGSGFSSPGQFTIEAIVKADGKTTGSAVNYIFQTRPGSDRGYYLIQDEDNVGAGSIGGLGSIIGNNFGNVGIATEFVADGTWLYIAAVIDLTSVAGMASANIYTANLSAGDIAPSLSLSKTWNTASPSALAGELGVFGIGNFAIDRNGDGVAEASQEWFQGAIDYVAIYDSLLDPTDLSDNLRARIGTPVPEPGTLALLGLAALLVSGRRRH